MADTNEKKAAAEAPAAAAEAPAAAAAEGETFTAKLGGLLNTAVSEASKITKSIGETAQAKYENAKARPTTIKCKQCRTPYKVPDSVDWSYSCPNCTLSNPGTNEHCEACNTKQPDASFRCEKCETFNIIPSSNAMNDLGNAQRDASAWISATATSVKEGAAAKYEHLKSAPTSFKCPSCGGDVEVPAWPCAKCSFVNEAKKAECEMCQLSKAESASQPDSVLCAGCNSTVAVPSTNLSADASSTWFSIKKGAEGAADAAKRKYFELAKKPYVSCKACRNSMAIVVAAEGEKVENGGKPTACARCQSTDLETVEPAVAAPAAAAPAAESK